jgi:hypothetical protein
MTHPTEIKVNTAIGTCREHLSDDEWRETFAYSDAHGEYGLAIEMLADILIEKGAVLSEKQIESIKDAFQSMELHPGKRISYLEELRGRRLT